MSDRLAVFSEIRASASASAEVSARVERVSPLAYPGGSLQPGFVTVRYVFDPTSDRWVHSVTVSGLRYLMSGELGKARVQVTLWHEDVNMPGWLRDFVDSNTPSALPFIPAVSA